MSTSGNPTDDGLVERASIRISELVSDHISSAFDFDAVPDSTWANLTVRICDIAADEIRSALIAKQAEVDGLREALGKIATSDINNMETLHPLQCAVVARKALSHSSETGK